MHPCVAEETACAALAPTGRGPGRGQCLRAQQTLAPRCLPSHPDCNLIGEPLVDGIRAVDVHSKRAGLSAQHPLNDSSDDPSSLHG